jgi:hypothetical protein
MTVVEEARMADEIYKEYFTDISWYHTKSDEEEER